MGDGNVSDIPVVTNGVDNDVESSTVINNSGLSTSNFFCHSLIYAVLLNYVL